MLKNFSPCTYENTEWEQNRIGNNAREQNRIEYTRRIDSVQTYEFRMRENRV